MRSKTQGLTGATVWDVAHCGHGSHFENDPWVPLLKEALRPLATGDDRFRLPMVPWRFRTSEALHISGILQVSLFPSDAAQRVSTAGPGPPPATAGPAGPGSAKRAAPATGALVAQRQSSRLVSGRSRVQLPPRVPARRFSVARSSAFSVRQSASRACQLDESGQSSVGAASTRSAKAAIRVARLFRAPPASMKSVEASYERSSLPSAAARTACVRPCSRSATRRLICQNSSTSKVAFGTSSTSAPDAR